MVNGYFPGYGPWYELMTVWNNYGVFTVLLPLVLVFAVVFAILERIQLFKNSGVHMLIAIVIGFFTISNPSVSLFFMYLFQNLGWAIAILVAIIILIGLAIKPEEDTWRNIFMGVGGVLFLAILGRQTPVLGGRSGLQYIFGDQIWYWVQTNMPMVIILAILAICIFAVVKAGKGETPQQAAQIPVRRGS